MTTIDGKVVLNISKNIAADKPVIHVYDIISVECNHVHGWYLKKLLDRWDLMFKEDLEKLEAERCYLMELKFNEASPYKEWELVSIRS
jgi:hypothetical protein